MDLSLTFLRLEVITFFIFLIYNIYYIVSKIFDFLGKFSNIGRESRITKTIINKPVVSIEDDKISNLSEYKNKEELSQKDIHEINEILRNARNYISKMEYDLAKQMLISGLAVDKFNIDLNLELAGIYILEQDFKKAEYIYKDLLLLYSDNFEILKKLGYCLIMQEKYDLAIEIYKKANEIIEDDLEVITGLSELYYNKNMYLDSIGYTKTILSMNPKNIDNLLLLGASYKHLGKYLNSLNVYKRALEIQPNNTIAKNEIIELENLEYEKTVEQ